MLDFRGYIQIGRWMNGERDTLEEIHSREPKNIRCLDMKVTKSREATMNTIEPLTEQEYREQSIQLLRSISSNLGCLMTIAFIVIGLVALVGLGSCVAIAGGY